MTDEISSWTLEPTEFTPIRFIWGNEDYGYISRKHRESQKRSIKKIGTHVYIQRGKLLQVVKKEDFDALFNKRWIEA
jgi:hypothetical protein